MKKYLAAIFVTSVFTCHADEEWTPLFDGETLKGWVSRSGEPPKEGSWEVQEGSIHRAGAGGDLFTEKEYGDFEFSFEWKISEKGNSGVKYRVTSYGGAMLGPEFQVLDNKHPDGAKTTKRQAGALYDLVAPSGEDFLKPVGEWNQSRIVAKGPLLQHFVNGQKVVEISLDSEEWQDAYAASKYKKTKDFAQNPKGKIFLQDHNDEVWYRNLKIRELKE